MSYGRTTRWIVLAALWAYGPAGCGERDVTLGQRSYDGAEAPATITGDGGPGADAAAQRPPDARRSEDATVLRDAPKSDLGCLPVPSCNWCGAPGIYDDNGCLVGFGACANGAYPCEVQPCSQTPPTGCALDEYCGDDMLCWPKGGDDAGVGLSCLTAGSCATGTQYCERFTPGVCGGTPVPDGGTCGEGCYLTDCGGTGETVCMCDAYTCKALPASCTDCSCILATYTWASCTCSGDVATGFQVACAGV